MHVVLHHTITQDQKLKNTAGQSLWKPVATITTCSVPTYHITYKLTSQSLSWIATTESRCALDTATAFCLDLQLLDLHRLVLELRRLLLELHRLLLVEHCLLLVLL